MKETGYRFNCYGFVCHIITHTHEDAFKELLNLMQTLDKNGIPTSLDCEKPSPYNFFYIFRSLFLQELTCEHWEGIEDILTLQIGDVLVYMGHGYVSPSKWDKNDVSNSTGTHVMIVSEILSKSDNTLEIKIIDSTHKPHNDINDTRHIHKITSGIGECNIQIKKTDISHSYYLFWNNKSMFKKDFYAGRIKKALAT